MNHEGPEEFLCTGENHRTDFEEDRKIMMGLVQGKGNKSLEERVSYDENGDNGLILSNHYIPEEVLANILRYVHYKTLAKCMLVCKRWNALIQSYVWRKKSGMVLGYLLPSDEKIHWNLHYLICKENSPFGRNLIKNHSGSLGEKKYWKILRNDGDKWKVEEPPEGVPPLPETEPLFAERKTCFVTSFAYCGKQQTVDLLAEGLTPQILDNVQPPIAVSEWYSGRWDCRAMYQLSVRLLGENEEILDSFVFEDDNIQLNEWIQITHKFENYGRGLRKIAFLHQGKDRQFWAGHYGSKMAGACVKVEVPFQKKESIQK